MNSKRVVLEKFKQLLEIKYSGSTPSNYLSHVSKFLDHANNVPERVNNEDILNYNIHIRNMGHSYRNVAINAIKAYFKLYLKRKVKGFSSIRPPKRHIQPVVYNVPEMANKIRAIKNIKHKAALAITLCCWLRRGEVLNIKISDIDGKMKTLRINQSKSCKDRTLIISNTTLEILRQYYQEHRPNMYLFEGPKGGKYSASSLSKLAHRYLNTNMRFHAIRASGATYAVANGADIKSVSEMLGHSKIETTKFYIPTLYNNLPQVI